VTLTVVTKFDASGAIFQHGEIRGTLTSSAIRERSHSQIESRTKSTDANLTNAPDGTAHTLTVRECHPRAPCAGQAQSRLAGTRRGWPYALDVSPLDPLPHIRIGRELAKKPLRVQVLALVALAAFWVVTGIVLHRTWPAAVGAVFVVALVVKFVQARRERGAP